MERSEFNKLVLPYEGRVVLDIGTGDGLFVYRSARANPQTLFIGIDANRRLVEKISEKIYRKRARGGAPNAMFVQAAVEDLPQELNGLASEVHVNFPWGSLLRTVMGEDLASLRNLRRMCAEQAHLRIVLGVDPERDQTEIERLQVSTLSLDYVDTTLSANYPSAGFQIIERRLLDATGWSEIETTWARRLRGNANRVGICLLARCLD